MFIKQIYKKSSKPLIVIVALLVLLVTLLAVLYYSGFWRSNRQAANLLRGGLSDQKQQKNIPTEQMRLKIGKIGIDAPIIPLGLTPNGDMEAPSGPAEVGWYKFGPHPGEGGNAVLDGHYGPWENGKGSVFDNLTKLKKGDNILVIDGSGGEVTFMVRELKTYAAKADTTQVFKSSDGLSHLNIITCDGVWDKKTKSYSQRLVVFADKR